MHLSIISVFKKVHLEYNINNMYSLQLSCDEAILMFSLSSIPFEIFDSLLSAFSGFSTCFASFANFSIFEESPFDSLAGLLFELSTCRPFLRIVACSSGSLFDYGYISSSSFSSLSSYSSS